MFIRSGRGHPISRVSLSVETAFRRVWTAGVVTCSILLVLVQVLGVVRARIVRVTVWIICGLGLLRVTWLRLGSLGGPGLLSLSCWVWSGVATCLTFSSGGISRLRLLSCALRELGTSFGLWTTVTAV
jgi:hypothetical protein